MSLVLQSKLISINSKDGIARSNLSGSHLSNLFFPFKTILRDEKHNVYSTISIQSVEMANSFYNINENNSKIDVKITIVSTGTETTYTINIPFGNYSASSFLTQFNSSFLATTGYTGTLTLNLNNGIYTLSPDANTFTITILSSSTIYDVLGIASGTNPVFTFGQSNDFDFACNFLGVTRLKIFSQALACSNIDSAGLTHNNLIDIISVSAPSYGLITYNKNNHESELKNREIHGVDIMITDGDNNLVNFNYINWNITFLLNTYRIVDVKEILHSKEFHDYLANKPILPQLPKRSKESNESKEKPEPVVSTKQVSAEQVSAEQVLDEDLDLLMS